MEFPLVVTARPASHPFERWIEPDGMAYELPTISKVALAFRGSGAIPVEMSHRPEVIIWCPTDTEVWATLPDGTCEQIAGSRDIPAPGLDSAGAPLSVPARELIEKIFHDAAQRALLSVGTRGRDEWAGGLQVVQPHRACRM